MSNNLFNFGMIGLGVMGRSILLNTADYGFSVTGFDKGLIKNAAPGLTEGSRVKGVSDPALRVQQLQRPRKFFRYKLPILEYIPSAC
jgi:6-phosphogluconate dehydrogenase